MAAHRTMYDAGGNPVIIPAGVLEAHESPEAKKERIDKLAAASQAQDFVPLGQQLAGIPAAIGGAVKSYVGADKMLATQVPQGGMPAPQAPSAIADSPASAVPIHITNADPATQPAEGAAPPPGAPGAPAQVIPSTAGQLDRLGNHLARETQANERMAQEGANKEAEGIANQAAIESQLHAQQAEVMAQSQQEQATHAQAAMANANAMAAYQANDEKQLGDMTTEYQNAKTDPNRYWANKSTGQKIGAGIATFLSGIFSGIGGQHNNPVMDHIQNAIDRDIEEQHADHDKLKTAIGIKQNLAGMARQRFGDKAQAITASRIAALDMVKTKIDQYAEHSKSQSALANAQTLLGQVDQRQAQLRQTFTQQSGQLGLGILGQKVEQEKAAMAAQAAAAKATATGGATLPDYEGVLPKGRGEVAVRKEIGEYKSLRTGMADLMHYAEAKGGATGKLQGAELATAETKAQALRTRLMRYSGMTAEEAYKAVPNPADFGFVKSKYKGTAEYLDQNHDSYIQGFGLKRRTGDIAFTPGAPAGGGGEEAGEATADNETEE